MSRHFVSNILLMFPLVISLCGCAGVFFPDFNEGNDIVVDDGGKVEIRKVEEKGVLIGDKENALYEGDEDKEADETKLADSSLPSSSETEEITPAKVTEVTRTDDLPAVESQEDTSSTALNDAPNAPAMRYLAGVVYFANGGAYVDENGRALLRQIASKAKKHNASVEIFGFASSRTRNTDPVSHKLANFKISSDRANNVAAALHSLGVKNEQMAVQALSDSQPMYKEVMPEGERLNRRAEIYLTY